MEEISEITIKDIWPQLCDLGMIELRVDNRTVWSDFALDPLFEKSYYEAAVNDYLQCVKDYIDEWYSNFKITDINIKVVEFHHCVVDIKGYFEKENN